jgi:sigma-B regulation protein RsbU (phosphoserine phosphatase)
MHLLVVNTGRHIEDGAREALRRMPGGVTATNSFADAADAAAGGRCDTIIVTPPLRTSDTARHEYDALMLIASEKRLATIVVSDDQHPPVGLDESDEAFIRSDISADELRGRLTTIQRYQGIVQRMARELAGMERLGAQLRAHFGELDQEMRLAARLQRDFLPDLREPIGGLRFAALYRPASWVSGDIYDVFRIDEKHVGFYIADAVGHGVSAGLLTMFIKRAVVPKRIAEGGYEVCAPSEVIAGLNAALAEQALPHCQFITAVYGIVNTESLVMQYARGGHPYPMHISADGAISELHAPGGLLGLAPGDDYPTREVQLRPGDKILFYSDGVETEFALGTPDAPGEESDTTAYRAAFARVAGMDVAAMLQALDEQLNSERGSLSARDDVTLLGMQVPGES